MDTWKIFNHDGTSVNRVPGAPVTGLKSLEECREKLREFKNRYQLQNYYIWYAEAISPEGETHQIRDFTVPYRD